MPEHSDKTAHGASTLAPGLYVVGTPIGNLEDITLRALRVLKEADLIACEDTRQTQKLLNRYGIAKRTISYHQHNEKERALELVAELVNGTRIALVTDAGMPGISDPGFGLISLAIEHDVPVIPIPGPTAFTAALIASGMPTDSFCFRGFLPAKRGQRRQILARIKDSAQTEIFYEAPHRVKDAVTDVLEVLGEHRPVVIARELTKVHEELLRGTAAEVLRTFEGRAEMRGEITFLIGKAEQMEDGALPRAVSVRERVRQIIAEENVDEKTALKRVAKERGISKSEAYRELQRKS